MESIKMSMLSKRIKDWATSITDFRTGDVIPVDGPDGTAKVSKDTLLALTAQNAVDSGVAADANVQKQLEADVFNDNEASLDRDTYSTDVIASITQDSYLDGYKVQCYGVYASLSTGDSIAPYFQVFGFQVEKGKTYKVSGARGNGRGSDPFGVICSSALPPDVTTTLYGVRLVPHGVSYDTIKNDQTFLFISPIDGYVYINCKKTGSVTLDEVSRSLVLEHVKALDGDIEELESDVANNTITRYGTIETSDVEVLSGKYISRIDGTAVSEGTSYYTDYVELKETDKYYISERAQYQTCGWAFYDGSKSFLGAGGYNSDSPNTAYIADSELVDFDEIVATYPTAKYVRFGSYGAALTIKKFVPYSADNAFAALSKTDALFGKKWVACGDSFTHGDFTGYSASDKYLNDGRYAGKYCVYPYIIGNRHNMEVLNIAVNGSTISQGSSSTSSSCFTYPTTGKLYTAIPADADIITLWFGINDSWLTGMTIGTDNDEDNTTFKGAWNVALNWILDNRPFAKLGVMISNMCKDDTWPTAVKEVCEKLGVPYLDVDGGRPLMLGVSSRNPAKWQAKQRILELQRCTESNTHPNPSAHKFQSLFIENWLKSL
jgi:hypothetical protein